MVVFGIWRGLECRKYRLDPDTYEDEIHTININDGSILINSSKKLYTNQEYCIERVQFNDSKVSSTITKSCSFQKWLLII